MQTDALRILRAIKKYSQGDVAKALKVNKHTYRRKEANMESLTLKEINALIELYDIRPESAADIFFTFKGATNATIVK